MAQLRVDGFTISVDGSAAGPDQTLGPPFGAGGSRLLDWVAPIVVGGERLFDDPADSAGLTAVEHVATPSATHVVMGRP